MKPLLLALGLTVAPLAASAGGIITDIPTLTWPTATETPAPACVTTPATACVVTGR